MCSRASETVNIVRNNSKYYENGDKDPETPRPRGRNSQNVSLDLEANILASASALRRVWPRPRLPAFNITVVAFDVSYKNALYKSAVIITAKITTRTTVRNISLVHK